MSDLVELDNELAGVLSLKDMAGGVLERLERLSGASGCALFAFDRTHVPQVIGGSLAEAMRAYTPDLIPEDHFQTYSLKLPMETFLTWDRGDFDRSKHMKSRPYNDFYEPHEIGFLQGIWPTGLPYGADGMFGLMLTTPDVFRPLTPAAYRALKHVEAPMRAAARRIARFREIERERDMLGALLRVTSGAFVLWGQDLRVAWVSPDADTCLEGGLPGDELNRVAAGALAQLRQPLASPEPSLLGRPLRLKSARGTAIVVEFSWLRTPDGHHWLLAELKDDPGRQPKLTALTPAERRVLHLLVRGLSNREIADELSISIETARTHVARVLGKLEVSSRSKAASFARHAGFSGDE